MSGRQDRTSSSAGHSGDWWDEWIDPGRTTSVSHHSHQSAPPHWNQSSNPPAAPTHQNTSYGIATNSTPRHPAYSGNVATGGAAPTALLARITSTPSAEPSFSRPSTHAPQHPYSIGYMPSSASSSNVRGSLPVTMHGARIDPSATATQPRPLPATYNQNRPPNVPSVPSTARSGAGPTRSTTRNRHRQEPTSIYARSATTARPPSSVNPAFAKTTASLQSSYSGAMSSSYSSLGGPATGSPYPLSGVPAPPLPNYTSSSMPGQNKTATYPSMPYAGASSSASAGNPDWNPAGGKHYLVHTLGRKKTWKILGGPRGAEYEVRYWIVCDPEWRFLEDDNAPVEVITGDLVRKGDRYRMDGLVKEVERRTLRKSEVAAVADKKGARDVRAQFCEYDGKDVPPEACLPGLLLNMSSDA